MHKRKMKLPNGFGSISLRKERRRKPYIVRKCIDGKQITIAYVETYEEGLSLLIGYNKNPALYSTMNITFEEVYKLMSAEHYGKLAENSVKNYESAYKHCEGLLKYKLNQIKLVDLQGVINKMRSKKIGAATQKKCRQIFHNIYNYALKYEIGGVTKDIADYVEIDSLKVQNERTPFTKRQLSKVKEVSSGKRILGTQLDDVLVRMSKAVEMLCYCGLRANEFLHLKKTEVKLKQRFFMVLDSKTEAGRNRIVPIHKKVLPLWEEFYKENKGQYLFSEGDGNRMEYHRFKNVFDRLMQELKIDHNPHECRHTCATWLDDVGANDVATKKILGHSMEGITKGVYTHKSIHELKKAIDLLK